MSADAPPQRPRDRRPRSGAPAESRPPSPPRTPAQIARRRRIALIAAIVVLVVGVVVVFLQACGGGSDDAPPAVGAAGVVPATALVYVHVSTDRDRAAVSRALALVNRFPSLAPIRNRVLRGLTSGASRFDYGSDVAPWLGRDAALAVVPSGSGAASSLIVASVEDRTRAGAFLRKIAGSATRTVYRGVAVDLYGNVATAFAGGYLAIGPSQAVHTAIDTAAGRTRALAGDAVFRRTTARLPADRAADAYASAAGVQRLLAAQTGAIGLAGTLLNQPGLRGTAVALAAEPGGVRVSVRSEVRPAARTAPAPFEPRLVTAVPADALAYFGTARFDRTASRLLALGAAGGLTGTQLTTALGRLGRDLDRKAGVDVQRDVLGPLRGEVALWLEPSIPTPSLTLVAKTRNDAATRRALLRLQPQIRALLTPRDGSGTAPTFTRSKIDGVEAWSLTLAPGVRIVYAVFDGKLVLSTSPAGLRSARSTGARLASSDSFTAAVGADPGRVTSLLFLDFRQLLRLGEQTGLSDNRSYLAVRDDLRKVRAVGASTTAENTTTSTDLFLEIPR